MQLLIIHRRGASSRKSARNKPPVFVSARNKPLVSYPHATSPWDHASCSMLHGASARNKPLVFESARYKPPRSSGGVQAVAWGGMRKEQFNDVLRSQVCEQFNDVLRPGV